MKRLYFVQTVGIVTGSVERIGRSLDTRTQEVCPLTQYCKEAKDSNRFQEYCIKCPKL